MTLPVTLLALPAVGAARPRRCAQRGRDRAAAAARRGGRVPRGWCGSTAAPRTAGWTPRCRRSPGRVRGTGGGVPAVAGPALRPRPVADGGAPRRSGRCSSLALLVVALAPVFALALMPAARDRGLAGVERSTTSGRGRSGRRSAWCCCALALPAAALDPRDARDALPRAVRDHPRACSTPRAGAGRAGARDARREPRRPHGLGRLLAAGSRALRGRARPPGGAARAGLGPGVDGGRARRPARRGDHPRRGAGHHAASSSRRRPRPPRWRSTTSGCGPTCRRAWRSCGCRGCGSWRRATPARRRIERNLHDGAQQQLVALALELRVLQARALKDPAEDRRAVRAAGERAGRAARAGPRHPPRDPHRPRARAGDQLARRARRRCRWRSTSRCRGAAARAGRGRGVLPRRRGADQRRPLRGGVERARRGPARRRRARRAWWPTTASAASIRRSAAGCAGSTTASRRSAGRWRSTARSAAGRGCEARIPVPV